MPTEAEVTLQRGRDKTVRRRHPWLFSGAIAHVAGAPGPGDTVVVKAHDGAVLGRGAYSPTSQIRVRMWTFDDATPVDHALIDARVRAALARRDVVLDADTDACRLIFAESDELPGVIVDQYGDTLVVQCQSAGAERMRTAVVEALLRARRPARIVDRSDAEVRKKEGLALRVEVVHGTAPAGPLEAREHGLRYLVDVMAGHKTGFYLDQRDNRALVRALAPGKRVLNCFSYTGGFAVAALVGGAAHATSVDTSRPALELAERNVAQNGVPADRHDGIVGDCFDVLRAMFDEGERFDIVVLDPPKLAPSAAHVDKAAHAYKDLAHRGMKLLRPGGHLLTFSCSGAVDRALFRGLTSNAALEARRPMAIRRELGHAACHPVALSFPEGEYLKGLWLSE